MNFQLSVSGRYMIKLATGMLCEVFFYVCLSVCLIHVSTSRETHYKHFTILCK